MYVNWNALEGILNFEVVHFSRTWGITFEESTCDFTLCSRGSSNSSSEWLTEGGVGFFATAFLNMEAANAFFTE